MIYQWKIEGIVPVDAQSAGTEIKRIYDKFGGVSPKAVVDESRNETAVLHKCFEWNDKKAAEKYREQQAEKIIGLITVVNEQPERKDVRAFVHVQNSYHPIEVVVGDKEKMDEMLATALRELKSFESKYSTLQELSPVFEAIHQVKIPEVKMDAFRFERTPMTAFSARQGEAR
ncbi:MAG: hypothetical protein E7661_00725 [Ruminococcaceae bacterium]|nr:hypothetical protein [Oscillospiraceae bacterium]